MKKISYMLSVLTLGTLGFFLTGCSLFEDDPTEKEKLPPATQEGKGVFACLVDGKAWVAKSNTWSSPGTNAYYQEGVLSIYAGVITNNFFQNIGIGLLDHMLTEAEYILAEPPMGRVVLEDLRNDCEYRTSPNYSGRLIITHFDKARYIISGTFEFEVYSSKCDKVIRVTDGRFDLQYAP